MDFQQIIDHYIAYWTGYVDFSGKTSRPGYWWAFLCNFVVSFLVGLVAGFTGLTILSTLFTYATIIPGLAIGIRRLRDAGKHWAWIFINFVPLVGQIVYIVMLCQPSARKSSSRVIDADF